AGDDEQHYVVDPAAEETTDATQRDADKSRCDHRHETAQHRDARAENQPREIVAPKTIGAELVCGIRTFHPVRWQKTTGKVLSERIVRRQERREQRAEEDQSNDRGADPKPGAAPIAPAGCGLRKLGHAPRSLGSRTAFTRSAASVSPI